MEVYILDSLLRREQVVDRFESLIWTERWQTKGDFELVVKSTLENRSRFIPGTRLAMNLSMRVMTVETVQDSTSDDGKAVLLIKGPSLEQLLEDRAARYSWSNLLTEPKWIISGTPGNVARTMFDHVCRNGNLRLADKIPFLMPGSIMPTSTIAEDSTVITWEQAPASIYNAIQNLVSYYDLGFRIVRNFDMSQLYFDVYTGHDRTTRQTVHPSVVFAPNFDNLQNMTEFSTIEKSKNVAYVLSEWGAIEVYPDYVDPDVEGFERRVLVVILTDVKADTPYAEDIMRQRGLEELAKTRSFTAFDGELNQNSMYTYGTHYGLGDLVEVRNVDGVVTIRRVTEQIFSADGEGERSYPTLSSNLFINEGSWLAWNNSAVWEDFTTEFWADM